MIKTSGRMKASLREHQMKQRNLWVGISFLVGLFLSQTFKSYSFPNVKGLKGCTSAQYILLLVSLGMLRQLVITNVGAICIKSAKSCIERMLVLSKNPNRKSRLILGRVISQEQIIHGAAKSSKPMVFLTHKSC